MENILIHDITTLIFGLAVFVGVFLLLRKLILWYYKIDEIVRLLGEINNSLSSQNTVKENPTTESEPEKRQYVGLSEGLDLKSTEELESILERYEKDKSLCHPDYIKEVKKELSNRK